MSLINQLSDEKEPFATCLLSTDCTTTSGIEHRVLEDNGHSDILLRYMEDALQRHHISPEALQRHMDLIATLKIENLPILRSPYPQPSTTQKGNFAEVFLAEYLVSTTDMELPIYRLRYNTNPDQSMKGDDVLLFDLDSDPVRLSLIHISCGGRLCAQHGKDRGLSGHQRTGSDQPGHRYRDRLHGQRTGRCDHRQRLNGSFGTGFLPGGQHRRHHDADHQA